VTRTLSIAVGWLVAVLVAGSSSLLGQRPADAPAPLPSFSEPAISPDHSEIAVVSGGDLWTVPATGGEARLLVSDPAMESRPLYAPSGDRLAFVSDRTGGGDIYVLTFATGRVARVTFDDGIERLDGWSRDGRWLYFSSTSADVSGMNDVWRVRADGGTPMLVSADRYTSEFFAAPSPDGQILAITARGTSSAQWWRRGRSHLDESEIWLRHDGATPRYEPLTPRGAKSMWPMWMPDGKTIYFVSDRTGPQNIWTLPLGSAPKQVTRFTDGRVLWPAISADGRAIVFERDFEIWKLDTGTGDAAKVAIAKRGVPSSPSVDRKRLDRGFSDLALSPDGKKVAFAAHGDVWATSAREADDPFRVTRTSAREAQITWSPDSRRIVYASERDGVARLFQYDFVSRAETQLTHGATDDAAPRISPDGKSLAFVRDDKELRVMDLESKQERVLTTGHFLSSPRGLAWSPDGRWVAHIALSAKSFRNVFVVAAAGGESRPISALPNGNANSVSWSPDGTFIVFNTNQRTEESQVVRVDLILRTPKFREDRFQDLFKDEPPRSPTNPAPDPASTPVAAPTAAKNTAVEIVFDDIRRRLSILPVGVDVNPQVISPDGKWLLLTASAEGQQNLYTYSIDELSREAPVARQLTSTGGPKADAQFSPDSKEVFYLDEGRIFSIPLESRQSRQLSVTAEMDVDFAQEKMEVFRQAWTYLRDGFYDDKFHGVDWDGVRTQYAPRLAGAQTPAEMRRLLNLMVGELNASHMGVGGPPAEAPRPTAGKLGLRFDRAEYERSGRLRIAEIVPLGPVAVTREVKVGEYLTAIDGVRVSAETNLDERLQHTINRRVALTFSAAADGAKGRNVVVRPINQATEKNLLYRDWVESNRAYVEKISGGRLGYAHMNDMSADALRRFYTDLDADTRAKDGVVIDVRNNNGGFVNVYAIDVLARRGYMMMTPRNLPTAPARTVLGQRALELPTILVTNQHSLSDAEDFTEGYRTLKLGKVVGEPTSGWIIYTGGQTLVDGSTLRMPSTRITTLNGETMELKPRPVDVPVTRPIGETYTGSDSQLKTAVDELLKQLGTSTSTGRR
jgi:tricorn protease